MKSFKSTLSALSLIAQPLLLNIISVPVTAYIIRTLGPKGYGEWSVAVALVATTSFITNLGLRAQFVRNVARDPSTAPSAMADQLGLRLVLSLIAGLGAVLFGACMGYSATVIGCIALAALSMMLMTIASAGNDLFQGIQRIGSLASINLAAGLTLTAASVATVWAGTGSVGLSAAYALGPAVSAALSLITIQKHCFPARIRFNLGAFVGLMKDARVLAVPAGVAVLSGQVEAILLPKLAGVEEYGLFVTGLLPATRLILVSEGLATLFYPRLIEKWKQSPEAATREVGRYLTITVLLCLPLAILVTFLAGPISAVLFQGREETCAMVMRISAWYLPLAGISQVLGCAALATGRDTDEAKSSIRTSVVTVILSAFLVAQWGIVGAAWSWVVRAIIPIVFRLPLIRSAFPGTTRHWPLLRILACGIAMATVMYCSLEPLGGRAVSQSGTQLQPITGVLLAALRMLTLGSALGITVFAVAAGALGLFKAKEIFRYLQPK